MTAKSSTRPVVRSAAGGLALLLIATAARAEGPEADYKAAYAAAEAASQQAGRLRNQWTTTLATLQDAAKAADKGDFDQATALSKEAEALAKASIVQAETEQQAWHALEIR
jgi:hypothetical protein